MIQKTFDAGLNGQLTITARFHVVISGGPGQSYTEIRRIADIVVQSINDDGTVAYTKTNFGDWYDDLYDFVELWGEDHFLRAGRGGF